jgi:hypothetical protein
VPKIVQNITKAKLIIFTFITCHDSGSSDDKSRDICAAEFVWPSKAKSHACAPLKLVHKNRQEDLKLTFDVSKCDKTFDALLRDNMIKSSHVICRLMS